MAALTTALMVGGAVAAGAVAAQGARQAAKKQQSANEAALAQQQKAADLAEKQRQEAVSRKETALAGADFPASFVSTPEGAEFKQTLQDRMAGRGLIDVDALSAPAAAQRRAGLEQTGAAISSTASARGLGRSTIPVAQTAEASQAAERDIAERVSQLELVRQEQIGQAVGQFGELSSRELASQQQKSIFETGGEFKIADTISENAEATKRDQFSIAATLKQNGAEAAAYKLKEAGIWGSSIIGATGGMTSQRNSQDLIDAITVQQAGKQPGAQVQIATQPSFQSNFSMGSGF